VLRPADAKYPPVVINSEGTWVRISKPPGASGRELATIPVAIPGESTFSGDAHELPDELWRDPSLLGSNITLVTSRKTQVFPISEPENLHQTVDDSEYLEEGEEASAPPPKRRAVGTTASTGRRQVYQTRRRSTPHPDPATTSAAPGGPPSEPEAPDEDPSEDLSEPGEPEGEEEEEISSDAPEAPPEGEDVEVEVEVEEEAAPSAPHAPGTVLQASPKAPTTRGSVSRFLSPDSTSAERSRSRHRDSAVEEDTPVAVTTSSARVSGTIQTQIFRDGTKAEVFVRDIPRPKTPPKSIYVHHHLDQHPNHQKLSHHHPVLVQLRGRRLQFHPGGKGLHVRPK